MTITRLANETDKQFIERLTAALAVKPTTGRISFKVSEKGALSVYGFQRFPITFYKETWQKLSETMPEILAFAKANDHLLKSKDDAPAAPATTTAPAQSSPNVLAAAALVGQVLPASAPLPEIGQLI